MLTAAVVPFALLGFLFGGAATVHAQVVPGTGAIQGVVRDTAGTPVAYAEITGTSGRVLSDSVGRFRLAALPAGAAVLQLRRIGYRATSWVGTVKAGETVPAEFALVPIARDLQAVVIAAPHTFNSRQMRGFYTRRQRYGGHFLTRADIAPHDNSQMTDLLRARIPGVSVSGSGLGGTRLRLRGQRCAPMVWIDGASTPAGEFDVDIIQPFTVAAIEVYPSVASVPAEFRTSMGRDNCGGTIVIWSRLGPHDDTVTSGPVAGASGPPIPVFHADEVDEPAAVDTATLVNPVYPDSLRAFSVPGAVVAQFVVDTTGAPVAGTITILSATHDLFAGAVTRAIAVSLFVPGRRNGQAVRQVLVVPFQFTTARR
ncbi:MAG: carboxypeptidase regulatory-like domain-containing protein [Gemmatimonadaceae bacterium]|nr:carboxypeptidase regulatory-like domain-containing protein [Gemmatimonadaceae bacterium]